METHNVTQLQQLLGSGNDIELLKKWVANDDGSFKLSWMNNLPQWGLLSKLTPLATMGISAVYSWKLVEDATDQAEVVFSGAQNYLLQHSNVQMSVLEAYEKSVQLIAQASPLLLDPEKSQDTEKSPETVQQITSESATTVVENEAITQVEVKVKTAEDEQKPKTEQDIHQDIQTLVDKHVDEKVEVKPVQSKPRRTAQKKTVTPTSQAEVKNQATTKTVTKKRTAAKTKPATQATQQVNDEAIDKSGNKTD